MAIIIWHNIILELLEHVARHTFIDMYIVYASFQELCNKTKLFNEHCLMRPSFFNPSKNRHSECVGQQRILYCSRYNDRFVSTACIRTLREKCTLFSLVHPESDCASAQLTSLPAIHCWFTHWLWVTFTRVAVGFTRPEIVYSQRGRHLGQRRHPLCPTEDQDGRTNRNYSYRRLGPGRTCRQMWVDFGIFPILTQSFSVECVLVVALFFHLPNTLPRWNHTNRPTENLRAEPMV